MAREQSAAVPAQRTGHPATPTTAPPHGAPPPPAPPPAMPQSRPPHPPQSAVPSGDPGATGRSDGSRTKASAASPAAPRGRDTTGRSGEGRPPGDGDAAGHLLGDGERDRLGQRLHHALAGFVDSPHDSVAEAAEALAAAEQELIAALRERRDALREGWRENGDPDGRGPDTEQLRLTLRSYREVMERLLRA